MSIQAGASVIKIHVLGDFSFRLLTVLTDHEVLSIVYHDCAGIIGISVVLIVIFWLVVAKIAVKSFLLWHVQASRLSLLLKFVLHEVV